MGRKQDPIVPVLHYFENVELPLAQQALALVKEIVRKRQPAPRRAPQPRKPQLAAAAGSAAD